MELDCDNHTMKFLLNGQMYRDIIPVPEGELWPWANIYNPGGTLTLVLGGRRARRKPEVLRGIPKKLSSWPSISCSNTSSEKEKRTCSLQ